MDRDENGHFKPGVGGAISGRWRPGQSGNPKGRPLARPFKDALERQLAQLALSKGIEPERGHDVLAAALLAKGMNGDVAAIKEAMDRIDGKVPNPIGGTDELPPITAFAWRPSPEPTSEAGKWDKGVAEIDRIREISQVARLTKEST